METTPKESIDQISTSVRADFLFLLDWSIAGTTGIRFLAGGEQHGGYQRWKL